MTAACPRRQKQPQQPCCAARPAAAVVGPPSLQAAVQLTIQDWPAVLPDGECTVLAWVHPALPDEGTLGMHRQAVPCLPRVTHSLKQA